MMTRVNIRYFAHLRNITGKLTEEIDLENPTIDSLLDRLATKYGKVFLREVSEPGCLLLANGRLLTQKSKVKFKEGDIVSFVFLVGGG